MQPEHPRLKRWSFNPHSRKGSDYAAGASPPETLEFQSTLPQGE